MRILLLLLIVGVAQAQEPGEVPPEAPSDAPSDAPAEDPSAVPPPPTAIAPEDAARHAQTAHDAYCADVHGSGEALAAQATSSVGEVWTEVVRSHEAHGTDYLLYWRGLLARCLGHTERARTSLEAFLAADLDPGLQGMKRDAEIRLRRLLKDLNQYEVPVSVRRGSAVAGVALTVSAAATGALAAWQADYFVVNRYNLTAVRHSTADADALIARGDEHLGAAIGLGVGSLGSLVGALVGFGRAGTKKPVAVIPVVTDDRVALVIGGRW